jgi:hypothetical protein
MGLAKVELKELRIGVIAQYTTEHSPGEGGWGGERRERNRNKKEPKQKYKYGPQATRKRWTCDSGYSGQLEHTEKATCLLHKQINNNKCPHSCFTPALNLLKLE